MHYDGLQAYIEENTIVEALPFDKLDYLFRIYLAIVIAILLVNLAHYYVKTIRKRRIRTLLLRTKRKLAAFFRSRAFSLRLNIRRFAFKNFFKFLIKLRK